MNIIKPLSDAISWAYLAITTSLEAKRLKEEDTEQKVDIILHSNPPKGFLAKIIDFFSSPSVLRIIAISLTLTTLILTGVGIPAIAIAAATAVSVSIGVTIESLRLRNLKNREIENKILHSINNDSKAVSSPIQELNIPYGPRPRPKEFNKTWSAFKAVFNSLPENAVSLVGPIMTMEPVTITLTSLSYFVAYLNTIKERAVLDEKMVDLRNDTSRIKNALGLTKNTKLRDLLPIYNLIQGVEKLEKATFASCLYETTIKSGFSAHQTFQSFIPRQETIQTYESKSSIQQGGFREPQLPLNSSISPPTTPLSISTTTHANAVTATRSAQSGRVP